MHTLDTQDRLLLEALQALWKIAFQESVRLLHLLLLQVEVSHLPEQPLTQYHRALQQPSTSPEGLCRTLQYQALLSATEANEPIFEK